MLICICGLLPNTVGFMEIRKLMKFQSVQSDIQFELFCWILLRRFDICSTYHFFPTKGCVESSHLNKGGSRNDNMLRTSMKN